MKLSPLIACVFFVSISLSRAASPPAFPGAEGAGAMASGGRGGEVYIVTNTHQDGPGSLADAISAPNRFIVFATSGIIDITGKKDGQPKGGKLELKHPNITIAGQTAPGEGICIKGGAFAINASNIVVRHIRVRRGFVDEGDAGDAVEINVKDPGYVKDKFKGSDRDTARERLAAGESLKPVSDVVFDHVSASWATDENFTISGHIDRVHAQHCFAAEALDYSNPKQTPPNHAYGSLMGGAGADARVGMHHSIFAHHRRRTPQCSTGDGSGDPPVVIDFRNNIVYNSIVAMSHTGGNPVRLNFVGNYYKTGPNSEEKLAGKWFTMLKGNEKSNLYAADNFIFGNPEATADNWRGVLFENKVSFQLSMVVEHEFDVPKITTQSANDAYEDNLNNAGATLPSRDAVDLRVAGHIRSGSGRVIGTELDLPENDRWPDYRSLTAPIDSDHDGMPDFWERQFQLDPRDPSDAMKIAAKGYANIEHYVNSTDPTGNSKPIVFVFATVSRGIVAGGQLAELRIVRTGGLTEALPVDYTIQGDAEPNKDYVALTRSITIPAGQASAAISIKPLPGVRAERVLVVTPTGVHVGCPSQAMVVLRSR